MKKYIGLHGAELLQHMIPNHAFAFISTAFTNTDENLEEIDNKIAVSGIAIDVY